MSVHIGSFGAILTGNQTVPDVTWTKIVFDNVEWDTGGRFDLRTGYFIAERDRKYHFAAGARLLLPAVAYATVDLMLYKNGEPFFDLTREAPLVKNRRSVVLSSRRTPQVQLAWGFTAGEVVARADDVFEVYIRHDCGERAHLTLHHPDAADGTALADLHPTYFMGVWHR